MSTYRGVKKRTFYTVARRQIDRPGGWDYWWEESKAPNAKAQKAEMKKAAKELNGYDEEDGMNPTFRLCKHTVEIVD